MVDHSSGHDKQREDGLNVTRMTRNFGGAQRKLRDTLIKQEKGYLGPYARILSPGDVQSLFFKPTDDGPFWMSREQQEKTWHDQVIQGQTRTRTLKKAEMKKLLEEKIYQQGEQQRIWQKFVRIMGYSPGLRAVK